MEADLRETGGAWQIGGAEAGWWAAERATFLAERLGSTIARSRLAVDLGCGRGEAVELLVDHGAAFVVGVDAEPFPSWRRRPGRAAFVVADLAHTPLRAGVADLVTSFDVIEHFRDDATPLGAARRLAADGATVAVTVPARPELWGPFDEAVGHHRRYTRPSLVAAAERSHLAPVDTTYFFSWLTIPAFVVRGRDRTSADHDAGGLVRRGISAICAIERALLRRWSLPIGTSLWIRCRPTPISSEL